MKRRGCCRGSAKLAPLYDLTCAAVYKGVDQHLPQSIGGKMLAVELRAQHWRVLAETVGLSAAGTVRRVGELAETVQSERERVAAEITRAYGDPSRILEKVGHEIGKRCRGIQRSL